MCVFRFSVEGGRAFSSLVDEMKNSALGHGAVAAEMAADARYDAVLRAWYVSLQYAFLWIDIICKERLFLLETYVWTCVTLPSSLCDASANILELTDDSGAAVFL